MENKNPHCTDTSYTDRYCDLGWNQYNFSHYEVERSSDGINFSYLIRKNVQGNPSSREYYLFNDNLAVVSGSVFFYRLKMIDIDGTFSYNNVTMIRKDQKLKQGITFNPNPVINGQLATIRFEADVNSVVEFKVLDISGQVVLKQQNNVMQGINSITINNLQLLTPGLYVLEMNNGQETSITKFVLSK